MSNGLGWSHALAFDRSPYLKRCKIVHRRPAQDADAARFPRCCAVAVFTSRPHIESACKFLQLVRTSKLREPRDSAAESRKTNCFAHGGRAELLAVEKLV